MEKRGKKGLSPVVATVLLIAIAIALIIIIVVWARNFIGEDVLKGESGNEETIKNWCEKVDIIVDVVASEDKIIVQNNADVPILGVEIKKKTSGSIKTLGTINFQEQGTVTSGKTEVKDGLSVYLDEEIFSGDTILINPILLGTLNDEPTAYTCDDKYGVEVTAS